ncbi:MAG: monovalent cation/H+ antiporter subunit D family protein [Desulfobacterales bacterium]|jgi:multicomponent Na+:H+ antiporter subunit D|nr:monovalent cation/H+ antiporter subunit D family protein [Desulfobacterales bacterium]MDP6681701.1 monovalent cation/H+ antiporter subunit D family protein [Desulfobacterales bacterium]MDP6807436.1 monovalent cation/H+ antiporter subunit D family protein [Desulfobacterales bacterium]|tara:strand:- start:37705 stop:39204 length:1500 start_codon:yes stop_codon:yes gene_type:complete
MSQHFPAFIIVIPLIAAFFIFTAGWLKRTYCFYIAAVALAISLFSSFGLLLQVLQNKVVVYHFGGWSPPWGIAYRVDYLNGIVLVVSAAIAFLNLIATKKSVEKEFIERVGPFYALYVLFVTGTMGIVVTGDAFNLYVLLEIASLTGYALIGMGTEHAALASLNYVFMGTIGASFYLLGIGYLYIATGSLNMFDIASILPNIFQSNVVLFAFVICLTGLFIKMALFPMHTWLPNAYTYSPSPAISLIAPLTTKVMVYVMIRILLSVFTPSFSFKSMAVNTSFVWLAVIAIVVGSILALSQQSLKRMLSYVMIAEIGYMVGGFWLANRAGITGAILHIINDAAMTLCVFLVAGNILYRVPGDSFDNLKGLFRKMPFSMGAFVVGALSIIGVPPTCGFFSKWYLITGGIAAGHYGFVAALLFSSLVNVVLFFRIFEIGYFEPFGDLHISGSMDEEEKTFDDAPLGMLVPLMIVAAGLIALGIYTDTLVTKVIQFAIPGGIS